MGTTLGRCRAGDCSSRRPIPVCEAAHPMAMPTAPADAWQPTALSGAAIRLRDVRAFFTSWLCPMRAYRIVPRCAQIP